MDIAAACAAVGLPRATYYKWLKPPTSERKPRPGPERKLKPDERKEVREVLNSDRFVDKAPAEIYATLLDEGKHYCSIRTMYRILAENSEVRERRNQLTHPEYKKPELLATGPNQVWSWDITKLLGPAKWSYFYFYVIMDIFSRYIVGWMVAGRETADLATRLIRETCDKQGIDEHQLTIHSDRGSPMVAKTTAQLLADLGVTKSVSRPHVSNDNPFSEASFKTLKYRPNFPARFSAQPTARDHCADFVDWYNNDHRHSGIALLTPAMLHFGQGAKVLMARQQILEEAYRQHPERFVRGLPRVPELPLAVWINPPPLATGTSVNSTTPVSQST